MRDELNRKEFHEAIDSTLSGLQADPWLAQRVLNHERTCEPAVSKKSRRRNQNEKNDNRIILPGFMRTAAVLVACIALATGIALAASSYVRVQVMKMLANITPEYTELILSVEREVEVPANWYGYYYPGTVPEGSKLVDMESDEDYSCVYFTDEDAQGGWKLSFTEYDAAADVRIDTEDTRQIHSMINGHDVTVMEKEGLITIFWNDGQRLLILQTQHCSLSETITYASNIVMVK